MRERPLDKPFLWITALLAVAGFFMFASASLGLLARAEGLFSAIAFNQFFSLAVGVVLCFGASRLRFTFWHKYAFYIFAAGIIATLLVFVPMLGFSHGGARRWLMLGAFSFQPSELLKFGFIVYWSAWCAGVRGKIETFRHGVVPLVAFLAGAGVVLALQPDFGTFIMIGIAGLAIFIAAGARWRHVALLALAGSAALFALGLAVPYVQDRLLTFINPARDPLGAGYQIQQSLIAIGSGGVFGRGFGQSIQKFNFLPEPVGDSIFAVFAEEWGFVGSVLFLALLVAFLARGYRIATRAPTAWARLFVAGSVTIVTGQSLINIGSMLGLFPLTGDPLVFVSQGGSSLAMALLEAGIILNISKYQIS